MIGWKFNKIQGTINFFFLAKTKILLEFIEISNVTIYLQVPVISLAFLNAGMKFYPNIVWMAFVRRSQIIASQYYSSFGCCWSFLLFQSCIHFLKEICHLLLVINANINKQSCYVKNIFGYKGWIAAEKIVTDENLICGNDQSLWLTEISQEVAERKGQSVYWDD